MPESIFPRPNAREYAPMGQREPATATVNIDEARQASSLMSENHEQSRTGVRGPDGVRERTGERTSNRPSGERRRSPARSIPPALVPRQRPRKRRRRLAVLIVAILAIGVGWWVFARNRPPLEGPITTASVERRDFASSVLATGAVRPQVGAEVRVGARISGRVAKLRANIGDPVQQGQVIAELEQADLAALVAQREAELELAQAKLSAAENLWPKEIEQAQLDLARWQASRVYAEQEFAREQTLQVSQASSQQAYEQAEERLAIARAQVASAEKAHELAAARYQEEVRQAAAEVRRAESALANTQVQLSYATIKAPIDGVIASVSTQAGETVAAGLNAPTFVTIIDLERLQVHAFVDEVDIGRIQLGQKVRFTVDTFPDREFEGRVTTIHPKAVIQDNVVNYDVVIQLAETHAGELRPEMTASVNILLDARTDVLAVPARAVRRERGRNVVWVDEHGEAVQREIVTGWSDGPWIEVLRGLDEGQTVWLEPPPGSEF